ncbi:glycosyltransferase family 2 protein [Sphaerotilus sp.]|uniref:glycosyltransferase family 2 protein n=1 Tax=Sphaerotilus sp. TaxID=2093942 RepID=UPI002ACE0B5F|nr:glycosyltransferase family 2 protein [Sphaerotilus sp.]MDZ7858711.1 glycosyltransferase family 2 protein [Sphaerotilus sp.]
MLHFSLERAHRDWELLVIDDGSTDGTIERLTGLDPRIRFIRQANQGVAAARNTGIQQARGRFIAFMDSDDEWRPGFLALTTAFLRAHPDQHWVATESHEDLGDGSTPIHHSRHDIRHIYLGFARSIGSRSLELPADSDDDYLRIFENAELVDDWGRDILASLGRPKALVYHGSVLQHMRWGYLNWLPATVCTRHAVEVAGPFPVQYRNASDLRFFSALARAFAFNLIGVPLAIKYDRAAGNQPLTQAHLATGAGAYRFERSKLAWYDDTFGPSAAHDPEIALLRRHYCLEVAHRALAAGHREVAREHLRQAAAWRTRLWRAWPMQALCGLIQDDQRLASVYSRSIRLLDIAARLLTGRLSPRTLPTKVWHRALGVSTAALMVGSGLSLTDIALADLASLLGSTAPHHED